MLERFLQPAFGLGFQPFVIVYFDLRSIEILVIGFRQWFVDQDMTRESAHDKRQIIFIDVPFSDDGIDILQRFIAFGGDQDSGSIPIEPVSEGGFEGVGLVFLGVSIQIIVHGKIVPMLIPRMHRYARGLIKHDPMLVFIEDLLFELFDVYFFQFAVFLADQYRQILGP